MEVNKNVEQRETEELSGSDQQMQEKLNRAMDTPSALKPGLGCQSKEGIPFP